MERPPPAADWRKVHPSVARLEAATLKVAPPGPRTERSAAPVSPVAWMRTAAAELPDTVAVPVTVAPLLKVAGPATVSIPVEETASVPATVVLVEAVPISTPPPVVPSLSACPVAPTSAPVTIPPLRYTPVESKPTSTLPLIAPSPPSIVSTPPAAFAEPSPPRSESEPPELNAVAGWPATTVSEGAVEPAREMVKRPPTSCSNSRSPTATEVSSCASCLRALEEEELSASASEEEGEERRSHAARRRRAVAEPPRVSVPVVAEMSLSEMVTPLARTSPPASTTSAASVPVARLPTLSAVPSRLSPAVATLIAASACWGMKMFPPTSTLPQLLEEHPGVSVMCCAGPDVSAKFVEIAPIASELILGASSREPSASSMPPPPTIMLDPGLTRMAVSAAEEMMSAEEEPSAPV
mmetsp:Transcript_74/g.198  ORF Transcript_74/g.198 Transcript_74/m.198 type:complete len:411 (-) Transcript_74:751-1983(-)